MMRGEEDDADRKKEVMEEVRRRCEILGESQHVSADT